MKHSISNMWLLGLVALFIFVFAGFLAVTISYSVAFKTKNEMLNIIEKHNGLTYSTRTSTTSGQYSGKNIITGLGTLQTLNAYLYGMGYKVKSVCPSNEQHGTKNVVWYGIKDLKVGDWNNFSGVAEKAVAGKKYYYCVSKYYSVYCENGKAVNVKKNMNAAYYKVQIFYKMDLPVLGDIFTFKIDGTTADIYYPIDQTDQNTFRKVIQEVSTEVDCTS